MSRNNPVIGEVDLHVDDALLAEELAERAGALLLAAARRRRGRQDRRRGVARVPAGRAGRPPARRRGAVRGEPGPGRPAHRRAGLDRRPAGRHPGVRRGRPDRLGRARRALGERGDAGLPARSRCRRAARCARPGRRSRRRPGDASGGAVRRIAVEPDPAARLCCTRWPRSSAPSWCRWARPARRSPRCCAARSTPTSTPAASTSGTRPRRSRWRGPRGCTPAAIDGSPLRYNQPDPWLPDLLVCRRWGSRTGVVGLIGRHRTTSEGRTNAMTDPQRYQLSQLRTLEAEAIFIMREVVAEFERPVLLFSGGKDSIVMLRLAEKAFCPAPHPVPGDARRHRPQLPRGARLPRPPGRRARRAAGRRERARRRSTAARCASRRTAPATGSRPRCCSTRWRSTASTRSSAAPGGTRRRPGPRSGSSRFRDEFGQWDPKNQRPELWGLYNGRHPRRRERSGSSRCPTGPSSTSGTTSRGSGIELPSIYFAHEREVVRPRRHALRASTSTCRPEAGEEVVVAAGALPHGRRRQPAPPRCASDADTVEKVIDEVAATRITERGATRGDDKVSEAAMEDRKREGYF